MTIDLLHHMARTLSSGLATMSGTLADDEALHAWAVDCLGVWIPRRTCRRWWIEHVVVTPGLIWAAD